MILPFKHGKVIDSRYFVNRKKDIAYLQNNFISKINTIMISPRRWGKSSLVKEAARGLDKNKKIKFVFLDMFNVRSEAEFYEVFTREVLKASYTGWEERVKKSKIFFKQLIPKFSFGLDPQNEFSVSFDWEAVAKTPAEILNLPEIISKEKEIELVICLDEFQNIAHFKKPVEFQKKLRANWQHHQVATYCLYGSKRNMMTEIFEHKAMPFYKFGDVFFLEKISTQHWVTYVLKKFKETNKTISKEHAALFIDLVENHSYFTQQLANIVWMNTLKETTKLIIEQSIKQLISQYDMLFQRELDSLTNHQVNFLKALVNKEPHLSNHKTIKKYKLRTSGNVNRVKLALISKEVIDIYHHKMEFLDPLFKLWFQRVYMN
jgi:AAA+ ATPase superfamily predicted ATPase